MLQIHKLMTNSLLVGFTVDSKATARDFGSWHQEPTPTIFMYKCSQLPGRWCAVSPLRRGVVQRSRQLAVARHHLFTAWPAHSDVYVLNRVPCRGTQSPFSLAVVCATYSTLPIRLVGSSATPMVLLK